ncbi:hypothetical protein TNCT_234791, partial [Trichonephila clavata]
PLSEKTKFHQSLVNTSQRGCFERHHFNIRSICKFWAMKFRII